MRVHALRGFKSHRYRHLAAEKPDKSGTTQRVFSQWVSVALVTLPGTEAVLQGARSVVISAGKWGALSPRVKYRRDRQIPLLCGENVVGVPPAGADQL